MSLNPAGFKPGRSLTDLAPGHSLLFESSLGGGQLGDGDTGRAARDVVEAGAMTEFHRIRITAVLAADANFEIFLGLPTTLDTKLDELADSGLGPVEIAQRLDQPIGQVELILNLRRRGA